MINFDDFKGESIKECNPIWPQTSFNLIIHTEY